MQVLDAIYWFISYPTGYAKGFGMYKLSYDLSTVISEVHLEVTHTMHQAMIINSRLWIASLTLSEKFRFMTSMNREYDQETYDEHGYPQQESDFTDTYGLRSFTLEATSLTFEMVDHSDAMDDQSVEADASTREYSVIVIV